MRTSILLVAVALLAAGAASPDLMQWQVKCGLGDNRYPFGNDFSTRFGVMEGSTWEYDLNDAAHPPIIDPVHDLTFIYHRYYYKVYRDNVLHDVYWKGRLRYHWDAPVGWPPPYGRHGTGVPDYPSPGLLKDVRMPVLTRGEPEIWLVHAYAPLGPENPDYDSETCSFLWEWNQEPGFEVPPAMVIQIWGNPDLESIGICGDLVLNDFGPGKHALTGIPQWGLSEEDMDYHRWVIQATYVPEPAVGQLAGLVVGMVGLIVRRKWRPEEA
jgi:hypothetical protein